MKKAFILLETTFAIVALVGLMMRLAFVTGGDFLLVVSLGLLTMLYFIGGYFQGPSKSANADGAPATEGTALKIWSGILFSIGIIGILGTLMFWSGFRFHLQIGLVGSLAILLGLFLASRRAGAPARSLVFRRSTIIAALCAGVWLVPKPTLFHVFHRNDPQLLEKWNRVQQHPGNTTYQAELDAYRREQFASKK
ncbi:hypothetical protein [Hymenobacter sp. DG25A]|uniref:hypothetical protein n=1 Tax=Hymenobacter sp. DG25A TaxID=1385663 RepID=UPI0006BD7722|nr:hypothetical protein [Hymenobacter sp. DG25A]ALD20672.1 hypothetical protein AM218_04835 [Hymenobacter sp. DG25A]